MMTQTPEMLAAAAANLLPTDPAPSDDDIDQVLNRLAAAFGTTDGVVAEARRMLHARFRIRMDLGETLKSAEGHEPWLAGRRSTITPFYWGRYRELLVRTGWSPMVVATLDRSTEELLDLLGNPATEHRWKRRGLVVGDVQSGKTASYAALIAKAADAGYRMVILLTGILENVRRQTQDRLDSAFVGLDSRDFLATGQIGRKTRIGVGLIDDSRDGIVFTSRDHDFRKATASALNISLDAVKEPVLVVTKKNKAVLQRLAGWLRAKNADREGQIDVPLLLIDDEADNASINTKQEPGEATAINKAIRNLLGTFRRSSYVGFTATPFANIFVDPASTHEMFGDDLFPSDFIHVLKAPDNYVGMDAFFPAIDSEPSGAGTQERPSAVLCTIDDEGDWLPIDHKSDANVEGLPDSLRLALRCFLLATTLRDLRAIMGDTGRGGGIHRSMLVNVSRFTAVQNRVADALHVELEGIRRAVRLHGALPPREAAAQSPEIAQLEVAFAEEFAGCTLAWPEVLVALHEALAPVAIQPVNQSTGAASLDYTKMAAAPGLRVVAVGGNSLSRGLTLEGLSTSYFLRGSRAYDTLLQMGRWFGYRDGYDDLCRLWLTDDAEDAYRHVAEATAELKRDFARMRRQQATPREFGLRVRAHPGTLLITARNKMASGIDVIGVDETRDVSFTGRGIETARLYADEKRNRQNLDLVERFVTGLVATRGEPEPSPHEGALVWDGIPAGRVADFVEAFLAHWRSESFQGDSLAAFLRDLPARNLASLEAWNVALLTGGEADEVPLRSLPGRRVQANKRPVLRSAVDDSLKVSGRNAKLGSRSDLRHGLSPKAVARVRSEIKEKGRPLQEEDYRQAMTNPLLVLYLLRGHEGAMEGPYLGLRDLVLPALALHFPGAPDPDAPRRLVRYRLNRVAQAELLPIDVNDEGASDDLDADD